jgi:hypothetical protein
MPVSGLVITLESDPRAHAQALQIMAQDPRITVGERFGLRLAAVSDTCSSAEAEELISALFRVPGVAFVDIVCIDMSLDDGMSRGDGDIDTGLPVDVATTPEPHDAEGGPH